MSKFLSVALAALCLVPALPPAASARTQQPAPQPQQEPAPKLTNKDVLDMLKAGLAPEIVLAKIKNSPTAFDTSATALQELKTAGVPDSVMLAMVEPVRASAEASSSASVAASLPPVEVRVSDGTEVEIELVNNASGQELKVGDVVSFRVVRPVVTNGVTIFEKDAPARARITTAKKAGHWGRAGKLEWAMQDVQSIDGQRVPARFTKREVGDSKGGTVAVGAVATTVLFPPAALLWGLKKGKPAIIAAGNRYTVFVHGDSAVKGRPLPPATAQATP